VVKAIDYDSIAEIYDLYVTSDYDVAFFVSEVRKVGGPVLELMAGTGRLSLPLLGAGARLVCVDNSRGMLDVLDRKLERHGLDAELHCMDVRNLDLPSSFELAILPFNAFMELVDERDQRAVLAAVYRCLEPGGRFVCTLHNPVVRRATVDGVLRTVGRFATIEGALVVSGVEEGGDPVVKRLQFFELYGTDGALIWKRLLPMEFSLIEHESFESMASDVGFRIDRVYGDYQRSPFEPATSPAMVFLLQKRSA